MAGKFTTNPTVHVMSLLHTAEYSVSQYLLRCVFLFKRKLSRHDDEAQLQEVEILRSLNPNTFQNYDSEQEDNGIINIIDFYPSPSQYHIVMELAAGGDVFDRLSKRKVYTEACARGLARRMLESIQFLHDKGIAHRDIKVSSPPAKL